MKALVTILIGLSPFLIQGQSLRLERSITLDAEVDNLEVDQFGNIYLILATEIRKLDPQGNFQASFADPSYGHIDQVDLLNALNPLIYYADFNQLRILDNRLNESQVFSMLSLGFNDPKLIAYADQNRFWVYDQSADRLLQYSLREGQIVNRSPIIGQVRPNRPAVELLFSSFDRSLVYLEQEGFLVFDALGAVERFIPMTAKLLSVDFNNNSLISLSEAGLISLQNLQKEAASQQFINPWPEAKKLVLQEDGLYLWNGKELRLYRFE